MTDQRDNKGTVSLRTRIVQAGHFIDPETGAIVPAIQPSTTFARRSDYELNGSFLYSRNGAPTVALAEKLLCELEGGFESRLFASGMGAVAALTETVAHGQRIAAPSVMYHGVKNWLLHLQKMRGITIDFYEAAELESLKAAIIPGKTALVWCETPVNPSWEVIDIAGAAALAHGAGAQLVVDSTCAPPVICQPLSLGADFVFHSVTKYLNGHSDVLAGVLTAGQASPRWEQVKIMQVSLGASLSSFDAYLLIRGLRTLHLRVEQSCRNALSFAQHFAGHPRLERVLYPGLSDHPQHQLARRQMPGGFGGMVSVLVKASEAECRALTAGLKVFIPATSLGGVESLAEHRKTIEGPTSLVPANLIRFSIGIEDVTDLIHDFSQALAGLELRNV